MLINILITSGGTVESIDPVRKITNMSTGSLGARICNAILRHRNTDELRIFYVCPRHAITPTPDDRVEIRETNSVLDVQRELQSILAETRIDYFIHAMAISDYYVDYVSNSNLISEKVGFCPQEKVLGLLQSGEDMKLDASRKISSHADDLWIHLRPTPKIISLVKSWQPDTFLVGFKLLTDVSETELFRVGFELLQKNHCDLVLANDLASIKSGNHTGMLIYPENRYDLIQGKDAIASYLVHTLFQRGKTHE